MKKISLGGLIVSILIYVAYVWYRSAAVQSSPDLLNLDPLYTNIRSESADLPGYLESENATKAQSRWKLVWADEFEGETIRQENWTLQVGGDLWGNNELQYYTDQAENCYVQNGRLVILGLKQSYRNKDYTSARITTKGKVNFLYGKIEIKAKLPQGQGLFPAFWLLPTENNYGTRRKNGEIDIMEMLGHKPQVIYGVAHYSLKNKAKSFGKYYGRQKDFINNYHIYSLEWTPQELKWSVDNQTYYSLDLNKTFTSTYQPYHKPFYLIMNLAIGGNWPGAPSPDTVFPAPVEIDYVRYYQSI